MATSFPRHRRADMRRLRQESGAFIKGCLLILRTGVLHAGAHPEGRTCAKQGRGTGRLCMVHQGGSQRESQQRRVFQKCRTSAECIASGKTPLVSSAQDRTTTAARPSYIIYTSFAKDISREKRSKKAAKFGLPPSRRREPSARVLSRPLQSTFICHLTV